MTKIFAIALLATCLYAGAASAAGGGGAEPMPLTNYTDLPPYHPLPACRTRRSCGYFRHHQPLYDYQPRYDDRY